MKNDVLKKYENYQKSGGQFELERGFLKISGPDRTDFLHRLTSQDIKNLPINSGAGAALLDPSGSALCLFKIYNLREFFLLVAEEKQIQKAAQTLEKMHFAEDIEIKDISSDLHFVSIQGPLVRKKLEEKFGALPIREGEIIQIEGGYLAKSSDFGTKEEGFHIFSREEFGDLGLPNLSQDLWSLMRTDSGFFDFGKDLDEKNIILEGPLDGFVSQNKGCYPGQETVERIFTYGNISKRLMGLKWNSNINPPEVSEKIKIKNKNDDAGYITSMHYIPWSKKWVGFGIVRKPFYEPGEKLSLESIDSAVEVFQLPHSFDIQKKERKI